MPRSGSSGRIQPGAATVAARDSTPSTSVRAARLTVIGLVTNLIAQIIVRRFEYERTGAE